MCFYQSNPKNFNFLHLREIPQPRKFPHPGVLVSIVLKVLPFLHRDDLEIPLLKVFVTILVVKKLPGGNHPAILLHPDQAAANLEDPADPGRLMFLAASNKKLPPEFEVIRLAGQVKTGSHGVRLQLHVHKHPGKGPGMAQGIRCSRVIDLRWLMLRRMHLFEGVQG